MGVDDAAVGDVELVEMISPGLQGGAVRASESDVVESSAQFAEGVGVCILPVLVEANGCPADGETVWWKPPSVSPSSTGSVPVSAWYRDG